MPLPNENKGSDGPSHARGVGLAHVVPCVGGGAGKTDGRGMMRVGMGMRMGMGMGMGMRMGMGRGRQGGRGSHR